LKDENAAYFIRCLCTNDVQSVVSIIDQIRLFRHRPNLRWQYRIHEQLALEGLHYAIRHADVSVLHVGYQEAAVAAKRERNLRLLQREEVDRPNDPYVLLNLGLTHHGMGRLPESLAYYRWSLERARPDQDLRKLYAMLAKVNRELGQTAEALRFCREGRARYGDDPELLTQEAWALYLSGDVAGAEARLLQLLQEPGQPDGRVEFGGDPGLRGHLTRHNLAVLYKSQNRVVEAEMYWRMVLVLADGPGIPRRPGRRGARCSVWTRTIAKPNATWPGSSSSHADPNRGHSVHRVGSKIRSPRSINSAFSAVLRFRSICLSGL
jgi:tetratricopeptide (TPR) repeat protein